MDLSKPHRKKRSSGRFIQLSLPVALACTLVLAVSCNGGQSPAYERENIKGAWIIDVVDGQPLPERDYMIASFTSSGTVSLQGLYTQADANYQWGYNTLLYEVYCCDLEVDGIYNGLLGYTTAMTTYQQYDFIDVQDSLMTISPRTYRIEDLDVDPGFSQLTMRKIPSNYSSSDSLQGVWQFQLRNGEDYSNHRMQFLADATMTISERTGENSWKIMGGGRGDSTDDGDNGDNGDNGSGDDGGADDGGGSITVDSDYYSLYHDFIALSIYDNSEFGTPSKWDVKGFIIDSLFRSEGLMYLHCGEDSYVLTFISSN